MGTLLRRSKRWMSELGQNRKSSRRAYVFRLPPKADSSRTSRHVRIVPISDIAMPHSQVHPLVDIRR